MRFEVCVTSAAAVKAAIDAGADRVELCADLAVGGTTPSAGLIEWAAAASTPQLAVHVLIRPRGGGFVYTAAEASVMHRDIAFAKAAGADGVVIGALTPSGTVDVPLCAGLVAAARPLSVTFHRAIDESSDQAAALEDVLALGVDRLLTSGGAATALDGADVIAAQVRRAAGRLTILAGGGVTESAAAELVRRTGVTELHFSARANGSPLPLAERIARIIRAAQPPAPDA